VDGVVSLLTDDAWLTMPPQPFEYQGHAAIASFLHDRAALRGLPLRLVPTRANGQPAFGCYLPDAHAAIAPPYGPMVLTLEGDRIFAITWFGDSSLFPTAGSPQRCAGSRVEGGLHHAGTVASDGRASRDRHVDAWDWTSGTRAPARHRRPRIHGLLLCQAGGCGGSAELDPLGGVGASGDRAEGVEDASGELSFECSECLFV
jgi:hypothetical protein